MLFKSLDLYFDMQAKLRVVFWFLKYDILLTKLNGSKYSYVSLTIQLNTSHLFAHC